MKNSTLLLRSLLIIAFLTGIAQLATLYSKTSHQTALPVENKIDSDHLSKSIKKESEKDMPLYLTGKWQVEYNDDSYKGAIVYNINKTKENLSATLFAYYPEGENMTYGNGEMVLEVKEFENYKGKGVYHLNYMGESYDTACEIDMIDANSFVLSYYFQNHPIQETWIRK